MYIWAFLISNSLCNNYKYSIDDNKIEVVKGSLIISKKIMYINRIYEIEIKRSILGRIFKIASIKFFSNGGYIKINYIDYNIVDDLVMKVKKEMSVSYER